MEGAYPGHTESLINVSPYKYKGPGGFTPPKYIHEIPMPDIKRGIYKGYSAEERYLKTLSNKIDLIKSQDKNPSSCLNPLWDVEVNYHYPKSF